MRSRRTASLVPGSGSLWEPALPEMSQTTSLKDQDRLAHLSPCAEVLNCYSSDAKASFSKESMYGKQEQPNAVELVLPHLSARRQFGGRVWRRNIRRYALAEQHISESQRLPDV